MNEDLNNAFASAIAARNYLERYVMTHEDEEESWTDAFVRLDEIIFELKVRRET
jgi:hypothetical protein